MDRMPLGLDELVERWTVLADDQDLIAGKRGPTRLGFAPLLKFFTQYGRFQAAGGPGGRPAAGAVRRRRAESGVGVADAGRG